MSAPKVTPERNQFCGALGCPGGPHHAHDPADGWALPETLTRAQIRGLHAVTRSAAVGRSCVVALHGADQNAIRRGETRAIARQRICDAINRREGR